MAPFYVRSKVFMAPFQVQSKFSFFALHIKGSNADFALHIERAMQTLLRIWSGDTVSGTKKKQKIAISAIFFFFLYFALRDPKSTQFQYYLGPSPHDLRTLIHFNVVLIVFHIDHISQGVCKTVRTTFQCIVVLQGLGYTERPWIFFRIKTMLLEKF